PSATALTISSVTMPSSGLRQKSAALMAHGSGETAAKPYRFNRLPPPGRPCITVAVSDSRRGDCSSLMLTLFQHPFCPHSRFVRLALGEHGLDARLIEERVWDRRQGFLE